MNSRDSLQNLIAQALLNDIQIENVDLADLPQTHEHAYTMQQQMIEQLSRNVCGWKIAATNVTGQQHIGVTHPLAGRLFTETTYFSGEKIEFANNQMTVAEAELAFVMGDDLPAREKDYAETEVKAAVEALYPAIELPDSRLTHYASAGAAALIVDNACARDFVLGHAAPESWREVDLSAQTVNVSVNNEHVVTGYGSDVLGDPFTALTWLVNHANKTGQGVKAGEIITTGVLGKPVPVARGSNVNADFGMLGIVSVKLV